MASGDYFLTDVIAGAMVGTACGFLVLWVHSRIFSSEKSDDEGMVDNAVKALPTSIIQSHYRIKIRPLLWIIDCFSVLIVTITVMGRLISGEHWFTDIVGGLILSATLIMFYHSVNSHLQSNDKRSTLVYASNKRSYEIDRDLYYSFQGKLHN